MSGPDEIPPEVPAPPWHRPPPGPRHEPPPVPLVELPADDPTSVLRRQRRVVLSGELDHREADRLCLELMALDGESPAPVTLTVNSSGGSDAAALAVLDVVDLMRAPVHVTVVGAASGTAAAVLACATGTRKVGPHATVTLRTRHHERASGPAKDLTSEAERIALDRRHLATVLARATGWTIERADAELETGEVFDADAAVAAGLADEVARPAR